MCNCIKVEQFVNVVCVVTAADGRGNYVLRRRKTTDAPRNAYHKHNKRLEFDGDTQAPKDNRKRNKTGRPRLQYRLPGDVSLLIFLMNAKSRQHVTITTPTQVIDFSVMV